MEQAAGQKGAVREAILTYRQAGQELRVPVGTEQWYAWLESAAAFSFTDEAGSFTAHKARSGNGRGGWYWRAYRRRLGRLSRCYLGKSADLSIDRLRDAARQLTAAAADEPTALVATSAVAATAPAPDDTLVVTKLFVPRLSVQHVPRPRLLALLDHAVATSALTLVAAPAGSGKTTLLAEWVGQWSPSAPGANGVAPIARSAWLALESADDDPLRFITYVTAALGRLDPRIGQQARAILRAARGDLDRALASLINDLAAYLTQDAVLILDDYHLITTPAAHSALLFLLDHLPARLRLVIGTRVDPPLPLARLRARGQLSELHGADLRFASAEAVAFLRGMGLELSTDEVASLEQRTEGWVAGIQLLALALRDHADPAALLHTFSGSHRFIAEYLSEEVLQSRPAAQRDFLLRTSVLERLCGPLCDALTGRSDGQAMLADLRRANLFISALDDAELWYRYHPLFAGALRDQLQRQEPALVATLYQRAGAWYERQDLIFQATEYTLLAGDYAHGAALMEQQARNMVRRGDLTALRRWVERLPDAVLFEHPHLCLAVVWALLYEGRDVRMLEVMAQVERYLREHQHDGATREWLELQGELRIFEAVTALPQNDTANAIALAGAALEALPDDAHYLRNLASLSLAIAMGAAYRASGDIAAAEQVLTQVSVQKLEDYHFLSMIAMHDLAELYQAQGQLRKMARHYEHLLALLPPISELPGRLIFFVCFDYAGLMYEWNRLDEAEIYIDRILQALHQQGEVDWMVGLIMPVQARIYVAQQRIAAALQVLPAMDAMLATVTIPPPLLDDAAVQRVHILLAVGRLEEPLRWARQCTLRPDDKIDEQVDAGLFFHYMTLARVLIEQARGEQTRAGLADAMRLLANWRGFTEQRGFTGWLIEVLAIEALALDVGGDTPQAVATLQRALTLAEPEGYIRIFADAGAPLRRLLTRLASQRQQAPAVSLAYIQTLIAALDSGPHPVPGSQLAAPGYAAPGPRPPALIEPLTPREHEVLKLLAAGASNQEIAGELIITANTAKRHVKHILGKLGVANRTQAVVRARELTLL